MAKLTNFLEANKTFFKLLFQGLGIIVWLIVTIVIHAIHSIGKILLALPGYIWFWLFWAIIMLILKLENYVDAERNKEVLNNPNNLKVKMGKIYYPDLFKFKRAQKIN